MAATIYIVGWEGSKLIYTGKATIPAMNAKSLAEYFHTKLWIAGTHGVFINSQGNEVLTWGWKMGHKEIRSIPTYVKGWEMYASKAAVAQFKKRGY